MFPTTVGIVLNVAGAPMGRAFISRYGMFCGVWFFGLLQTVSNLGYSVVEWFNLGRCGLYGASMFESLSGGFGTTAFLVFLMNVCQKEHATAQYAFLSSDVLSDRKVDRRPKRSWRRQLRLRQFLCAYLSPLDAGIFIAAKNKTMDSRRSEAGFPSSFAFALPYTRKFAGLHLNGRMARR